MKTKIASLILGLILTTSSFALAFPPLPGPIVVPPTPQPDTRIPITLCVKGSTSAPSSPPVCGEPIHAIVGETVTLSIEATTLPTSVNAIVNGTHQTFPVDASGSLGTYAVTTPGMWRLIIIPDKIYHGGFLMMFVGSTQVHTDKVKKKK
jgi:hypothetical protein